EREADAEGDAPGDGEGEAADASLTRPREGREDEAPREPAARGERGLRRPPHEVRTDRADPRARLPRGGNRRQYRNPARGQPKPVSDWSPGHSSAGLRRADLSRSARRVA